MRAELTNVVVSKICRLEIKRLEEIAPPWIAAHDALENLKEQSGADLYDKQAVMSHMQIVLEQEKRQTLEKEKTS